MYMVLEQDILYLQNHPWKKDKWRHSAHYMCSRICSFPPPLVRYFILNHSKENDVVFDPFSGKGTTALEALINNRIGWGNDVSPEAYVLTKAKVSNINQKKLFRFLNKLKTEMGFIKSIKDVDWRIKTFYNKKTLTQILELRHILNGKKDKYSIFTKALILGIIHGSSSNSLSLKCSHAYSMSPMYVKRYSYEHNLIKPTKNVIDCIKNKAIEYFKDGQINRKGKSFNFDSRRLKIKSSTVNLIITSPPYFAIQTYAYDNWLRLWFLGYNYKEVNKLLVNTNSEERYGDFMYKSIKQMYRILKNGSKCFIVVGDVKKSTSKGIIIINTADFLKDYAEKVGFKTEDILVDKIPQTKKVLNSSLCTTGITTERILCLKKE